MFTFMTGLENGDLFSGIRIPFDSSLNSDPMQSFAPGFPVYSLQKLK